MIIYVFLSLLLLMLSLFRKNKFDKDVTRDKEMSIILKAF